MSQREYWCFISYRHLDNKDEGRQWATWLHQALETYEVPEDLVGTRNERGEIIPARLFPVFRDEEELATGDLTQRIYDALDRTRTLIVVCSPRVAQSSFVDKEIRYFKQLKKPAADKRIHPCIIDGDPNVSVDGGPSCFPDTLRYEIEGDLIVRDRPVAPLGADLRLANGLQGWTTPEAYRRALEDGLKPQKREEVENLVTAYGQQLKTSLLRLISGVLGVSFGTLQARDKTYQLKLARIAGARQTLELARAINDEDPVTALKHALAALDCLEKDDPASLEEAYKAVEQVVRTGRWARIGENVRSMVPMADGRSLLVVHGDDVVELIQTADLASGWASSGIREVPPAWGPNSIWLSVGTGPALDTRDGTFGLKTVRGVTEITQPADNDQWRFVASHNHPHAECSVAFAQCFVTSINDDDEWAAVDSFVDLVDFSKGSVSRNIGDVYDVLESGRTEIPCLITRENDGWHLTTAKGTKRLGSGFQRDSFTFSPGGLYVLAKAPASTTVFCCSTAAPLFIREHEQTSSRAAFCADDTFLMVVEGARAQILSAPKFEVVVTSDGGFSAVSAVRELTGLAACWLLSSDKDEEVVAYRNQRLWRGLGSIDPSGHLAAPKADRGAFLDLSTGKQISIPALGHAFGTKPGVSVFATFHRLSADVSDTPDRIDRIALRNVRKPAKVLHEVDRPDPQYGESEITFGQSGEFFHVTTYEEEHPFDPPFRLRYTHQTDFFDAYGGNRIGTVQFAVKSCTPSRDRAGTLLICQGSTEKRDDLRVILSRTTRSILWVADTAGDRIEAVFSSDREKPRYFIVGFKFAPGAVHRVSDGEKVTDLSGAIVRAEFLPGGRYLVAWYKNGRSELWEFREHRAALLSVLGLIVAEVRLIPGTHRLLVRHDDGRAYLIDTDWLRKIRTRTVRQIVEDLRGKRAGPASSPWWQARHPDHYPWKELAPVEPEEDAADEPDGWE